MQTFVLACLTLAMLMVGALIAADLSTLMVSPPLVVQNSPELPGEGNAAVIAAFYDAVNDVLRGGEPHRLAAFVSPVVETHEPAAERRRGREALAQYLMELKRREVARLEVVRIMGNGNDLAALVEETRAVPTDAASTPWQLVELFHLEGGQIVAYWPGSSSNDSSLFSVPAATVDGSPDDLGISLTRFELDQRAARTSLGAPFPHLLLVETGAVVVATTDTLALARHGETHFRALTAGGGGDLLLGPGDALLVPADARLTVSHAGETPASALSLLLAPRPALFSPPPVSRLEAPTLLAMHDPSRVGSHVSWGNGIVSEALAFGILPADAGSGAAPVTLRGESLRIEREGQQPAPLPDAMRFVIVETGILALGDRSSTPTPVDAPRSAKRASAPASRLYRAGEVVGIEKGRDPMFANAGSTPLELLTLAVSRT
jgi:hypothetical protein